MNLKNDIDFLANFYLKAQVISKNILNGLPIIHKPKKNRKTNGLLTIIQYSDIKNTWDVPTLMGESDGISQTLKILASKISYMIDRGRCKDVKPMVERIINKGVKNLRQPGYSTGEWVTIDGNEKFRNLGNIGKGHFRWNYSAHTLTENEIQHLKKYFKL